MIKLVQLFDELLEKISRSGLVICLLATLFLALSSIVLRWLGSSLNWIDPLVRHLVFISAFFGGSIATKSNQHIKVDLLTKIIEWADSKIVSWLHRNLISFFCFVIAIVLVKSGWDFYIVEKEFGNTSFLGIHSSVMVGIIPMGMGLISLRFLNQLILGTLGGNK